MRRQMLTDHAYVRMVLLSINEQIATPLPPSQGAKMKIQQSWEKGGKEVPNKSGK